jgi:hypothetical protein
LNDNSASSSSFSSWCQTHCFSTLNHIVGHCYSDARVVRWLVKQALHGFQGIHGNME